MPPARAPARRCRADGGWFGTHLVVVLLFVGLVAFCTVYGADCMLFSAPASLRRGPGAHCAAPSGS